MYSLSTYFHFLIFVQDYYKELLRINFIFLCYVIFINLSEFRNVLIEGLKKSKLINGNSIYKVPFSFEFYIHLLCI